MTTTSGTKSARFLIILLLACAILQTGARMYRRHSARRAAAVHPAVIGDQLPELVHAIYREHAAGARTPQYQRPTCIALIAYLSTCPACEKLAASGVYRDSVRFAGIHLPAMWIGGSHDGGRAEWIKRHGIDNAVSITELEWRRAGIQIVPLLLLIDSSGRLLTATSPWPDHLAQLEPGDAPQLMSCGPAL